MSKPLLAMHSALATVAKPGHYGAPGQTGATLTELTGLSFAAISVRGNQTADLSAAIKREFGAPLPVWPGRTAQDSAAFVWSGYDQWLAVGAAADNLVQRLSSCAGALGSVTDLTGARTLLRISGPRARDGLIKVVPIDLDESTFTTGSAAMTVAEHIAVQLWQIDAAPSYEIACPRSYGVSLWNALTSSFAEYGYSSGSRMA